MLFKITFVVVGVLSATLCASSAWAVQIHGGAEGLVVHQIGHILFIVGMAYLLLRLHRVKLNGVGWTEFKTFLFLVILWNLLTLSGHFLNEFVASEKFKTSGGQTASFTIDSALDLFYFLSRLDHLILVPAFLLLLLALRKWRVQ